MNTVSVGDRKTASKREVKTWESESEPERKSGLGEGMRESEREGVSD